MKYLVSIILILFLFQNLHGQRTLPSVDIYDLKGKRIDLSLAEHSSDFTVINFWATWCGPCKKELDNISELHEEWKDRYNAEVVAVSIDNARSKAKVKPMVDTKGWPFQIFLDPKQEMMQALNFQTVPYTLIVNKVGEIVYEHLGYMIGDEVEIEDFLEENMSKSSE